MLFWSGDTLQHITVLALIAILRNFLVFSSSLKIPDKIEDSIIILNGEWLNTSLFELWIFEFFLFNVFILVEKKLQLQHPIVLLITLLGIGIMDKTGFLDTLFYVLTRKLRRKVYEYLNVVLNVTTTEGKDLYIKLPVLYEEEYANNKLF